MVRPLVKDAVRAELDAHELVGHVVFSLHLFPYQKRLPRGPPRSAGPDGRQLPAFAVFTSGSPTWKEPTEQEVRKLPSLCLLVP